MGLYMRSNLYCIIQYLKSSKFLSAYSAGRNILPSYTPFQNILALSHGKYMSIPMHLAYSMDYQLI